MKIGKLVSTAMENRGSRTIVNCLIILMFTVYLFLGVFIYRDYGISVDEPTERTSTLVNVKYILNFFGIDKASEMEVPDLENYQYRYYGTFLQMPTMIFELHNEDMGLIFYGRHLYTFLLCLIGYVAFFLLCKTFFKSNLFAIMGTVMIALYPRFFAEQFYNIKDMIFVSTFMIAMYVTVKLIESKFKWSWMFCFAIATAVSANVRIVGAIFFILMLGFLLIDFLCGKIRKNTYEPQCKHPIVCGVLLFLFFFIIFVMTMPITWENPVQGIVDIFSKFSNYDEWDSTIVFMGKVIHKEELPWYYVPVWMLISLPVWYILLAIVTMVAGVGFFVKEIRSKGRHLLDLFLKYKYVIWCASLILGPWLGIVVMHSTLYNGWRHCYFMLPPLILLILFGMDYLFCHKRKFFLTLLPVAVIGVFLQVMWIINNHPYEMVYFNSIGKHFASSFDRDYWHLSSLQAIKYILQEEDEVFSIEAPGSNRYFLTDEEKNQIIEENLPSYKIETYRGKVGNEIEMDGYEEIYSIVVDEFKVATVFKKNGVN